MLVFHLLLDLTPLMQIHRLRWLCIAKKPSDGLHRNSWFSLRSWCFSIWSLIFRAPFGCKNFGEFMSAGIQNVLNSAWIPIPYLIHPRVSCLRIQSILNSRNSLFDNLIGFSVGFSHNKIWKRRKSIQIINQNYNY